ncbi:alpha/beta hydrolase [Paenibacillus wulumuqiensis]|uniref:alpha/beta hydrolase n=1 Tax=Paenibacillus wulumuqiensis TaxID=1567107 RepID=UPI00061974D4|nr:alpha/beta hydrolase [Paenibacillus wulumuqiensis]
MQERTFRMTDEEGIHVHIYEWLPDEQPIQGIVQISHGMAETARRYQRLARSLTSHGYAVYANDHRGHGLTAATPEDIGDPGEDGFYWMEEDLAMLSRWIHERYTALPLYMLGHSMGSFIVQKLMYEHPELYDGFILSGTNGPRGLLQAGARLALLQSRLHGPMHRSMLLNALVFGPFNRGLPRPRKTRFDWLSRDPEEVALFINDPYCAQLASVRFYVHFFQLLIEIHQPAHMQRIPKDKPVYLFSGDRDPVGGYGKGVRKLYEQYQRLQLGDVEMKLYPDARHETLNDTNREEVTADILDWLGRHCLTAK